MPSLDPILTFAFMANAKPDLLAAPQTGSVATSRISKLLRGQTICTTAP
jgi:hypothetical protein